MCSAKKVNLKSKDIVEFTLPRLHRGKQWYVDFFALDPAAGELRRKKYMLDREKTAKGREEMATILIANLYAKLRSGWSPFAPAESSRQYTELAVVVERYKQWVAVSSEKGTLKPKTAKDYLSRLKQVETYIAQMDRAPRFAHQLDTGFGVDFLDHLLYDKDVNARTRNNYRLWLSTFCTWMVERKYIEANPMDTIRMMKESEKLRDALPAEALVRLRDWTKRENPPFYLACMMEYYTFIRPDELRYIKIGDISQQEQTIYVNPEVSKNRKGQVVALNDTLVKVMEEQHIFSMPTDYYLFGYDLVPGARQTYVNRLRNEWKKVRAALGFPMSYQFYSLKDSGIRDLANAEGIVYARDQARHTDISITNKYLKSANVVHEEAKHFRGAL